MKYDSPFACFVSEHEGDDTVSLVLQRDKWPQVDVPLAAACIESRRKLRTKCPRWASSDIFCPLPLSAEQCSSEAAARYKASVATTLLRRMSSSVAPWRTVGSTGRSLPAGKPWRIADLTGGLGVDSSAFAKAGAEVLYNEMKAELREAAGHNFKALGLDVAISGIEIDSLSLRALLEDFRPDLVFVDPARRSASGSKVFRLEDCSPNVLDFYGMVLEAGTPLLLKLSPMADISAVSSALDCVSEVHIVQVGGECKELLLLLEPGFAGDRSLTVANMASDGTHSLRLAGSGGTRLDAGKVSPAVRYCSTLPSEGDLLFEPGKALMKAGAWAELTERYALSAFGNDAHLFICADTAGCCQDFSRGAGPAESQGHSIGTPPAGGQGFQIGTMQKAHLDELPPFGSFYRICEVFPFDKAGIKRIGAAYPRCEILARGIPMTSEELRRRSGTLSGGDVRIFALGSKLLGRHILVCRPAGLGAALDN